MTKTLEIKKDGNMWCVLWGKNLQVGISGFGKTIKEAILDFVINFCKENALAVYCKDCGATTEGESMISKPLKRRR